jgi:hypothetical protein
MTVVTTRRMTMTTTVPPGHLDAFEIDDDLRGAIRSVAREMLRDRTPMSLLPSVLRSHLALTESRCRCGHHGDWVRHMTDVLDIAGMVAHAF